MSSSLLRVEDLTIAFARGTRPVVRGLSFEIASGASFGLVGESGSGKSMASRAILGLLPPGATVSGRILLGERSLLELKPREMQELRGSRIAMIFQDPATALNPVLRVGDAIAQVIQSHERIDRRKARERAVELMRHVGIRDAARRARNHPHEFSGGMRQRVVIGLALAARPALLLADEPTTALDVIVQAGILRLLDRLRREDSMGLLLVSHDFSIVAGMCEWVGVMYAGELVEDGPSSEVLYEPRHPYTKALINSLPESTESGPLPAIPGTPPEPGNIPVGCAFSPRCPLAADDCRIGPIPFIRVGLNHRSRCIHVNRIGEMEIQRSRNADASA